MKCTMSKRNVAKFHKLLEMKAPVKDIVKILKVDKDTLKQFTPAKFEDFKKKQAEAAALAAEAEAETAEKVSNLKKAAKEIEKDAKKDTKKDK